MHRCHPLHKTAPPVEHSRRSPGIDAVRPPVCTPPNSKRALPMSLALLALLAFPPLDSHAQVSDITEAEMALIPEYCKDAQTFARRPNNGRYYGSSSDNLNPNAPKWIAVMGQGFFAIHHYCW